MPVGVRNISNACVLRKIRERWKVCIERNFPGANKAQTRLVVNFMEFPTFQNKGLDFACSVEADYTSLSFYAFGN